MGNSPSLKDVLKILHNEGVISDAVLLSVFQIYKFLENHDQNSLFHLCTEKNVDNNSRDGFIY